MKGPYAARSIPVEELTDKRVSNFDAKVVITPGCHVWTGATTGHRSHPYGQFRLGRSMYPAHRVAWVLEHHQDIPEGMVIDHICRVTLCVNPLHMRLVTQAENVQAAGQQRTPEGRFAGVA